MRTSVYASILAALVALPVFLAVQVNAADHREAPLVDGKPGADITDVFAFLDTNNSSRLVLAMAVNPFVVPGASGSYTFGPELLYQQDLRSVRLTGRNPRVAQFGPQVRAKQTGPQFIHGPSKFFGLDL